MVQNGLAQAPRGWEHDLCGRRDFLGRPTSTLPAGAKAWAGAGQGVAERTGRDWLWGLGEGWLELHPQAVDPEQRV